MPVNSDRNEFDDFPLLLKSFWYGSRGASGRYVTGRTWYLKNHVLHREFWDFIICYKKKSFWLSVHLIAFIGLKPKSKIIKLLNLLDNLLTTQNKNMITKNVIYLFFFLSVLLQHDFSLPFLNMWHPRSNIILIYLLNNLIPFSFKFFKVLVSAFAKICKIHLVIL